MDESWRMRMGVTLPNTFPTNPTRHSTEEREWNSSELEPEDFSDVFGGPPRSVLARKHSGDFSSHSDLFYREVFRAENEAPVTVPGRRLPGFVIPEGRVDRRRRKMNANGRLSRSKSTSASLLSFDEMGELSPYRPVDVGDHDVDVALSSYTSRLRPINVTTGWSSSTTSMMPRPKHNKQDLPPFGCNSTTIMDDSLYNNEHNHNNYTKRSFNFGYPPTVPSSETSVTETYDLQLNSPSVDLSSSSRHIKKEILLPMYGQTEVVVPALHTTDAEGISPCVFEMNSRSTDVQNSEAIDIDEAIAWAKEKFQGWSLDERVIEMQGDY